MKNTTLCGKILHFVVNYAFCGTISHFCGTISHFCDTISHFVVLLWYICGIFVIYLWYFLLWVKTTKNEKNIFEVLLNCTHINNEIAN